MPGVQSDAWSFGLCRTGEEGEVSFCGKELLFEIQTVDAIQVQGVDCFFLFYVDLI